MSNDDEIQKEIIRREVDDATVFAVMVLAAMGLVIGLIAGLLIGWLWL